MCSTFGMSRQKSTLCLYVRVYVCGKSRDNPRVVFHISNKNSTFLLDSFVFLKATVAAAAPRYYFHGVDAKGVIILRYMALVCKYEHEPIYAPQIL